MAEQHNTQIIRNSVYAGGAIGYKETRMNGFFWDFTIGGGFLIDQTVRFTNPYAESYFQSNTREIQRHNGFGWDQEARLSFGIGFRFEYLGHPNPYSLWPD